MEKKILLATGNSGKAAEILEVLGDLPFEFLTLKNLNLKNDAAETGATFAENAEIKARHFFAKTEIAAIGEDSGILVDALPGELGVKTRRFGAGENATDEKWLEFFLRKMKNAKTRRAEFFCAAAVFNGKNCEIFSGRTAGILLEKPAVKLPRGIPLSAIFVPENFTKTFAELSPAQKAAV